MISFEVNQQWRTRAGEVATIVGKRGPREKFPLEVRIGKRPYLSLHTADGRQEEGDLDFDDDLVTRLSD